MHTHTIGCSRPAKYRTPRMPSPHTLACLITLALLPLSAPAHAADDPETFFETEVRPLLHKRCFECHGDKKQQADIRLDRRHDLRGENDAEGLVVPGKPDDSRLLQVVRYSGDDTQMPPTGKLPDAEIATLTKWIETGAYWPEEATTTPAQPGGIPKTSDGTIDFAAAIQQHWAYQPIVQPDLPTPQTGDSDQPIDRFLAVKLHAAGLTLSPQADRRTLIRRATLDLWGIPPTDQEVTAFQNDNRPDAWPRLIDRLLDSPLYGQRWGRHWLDIARYADTKGYVFTENPTYPFAYTYRDYVVHSFNSDKPFDRFVTEQLAAGSSGTPRERPGPRRPRLHHRRPPLPQSPARYHRRPHRRRHPRADGDDAGLRPLPRPQVRSPSHC